VRFQVVTGSYAFLESPPLSHFEIPGVPTSLITTTDETGTARATLRVTALAPNQTATVRVTDLGTGAYREASFAIAQFTGNTPAFFTLPSSITFTGPYEDVCASGGAASTDVSVYGGMPPYAISGGTGSFSVSPTTVATNGGHFTVELFGVPPGGTPTCFEGASVGVTDATGRTIAVTVNNKPGTGTVPDPAISLSPDRLTLLCGLSGSFVIVNGEPPFNVGFSHPRITALVGPDPATGRVVTVTRLTADPLASYAASAQVTVTDGTGSAVATISVPASCP
jgi:hypothetical protein